MAYKMNLPPDVRKRVLELLTERVEEQREQAEPWERQHDESAPAYAAFEAYRDMQPTKRSYRAVAALLGKSPSLVARWSSGYKWQARAEMWDRQRDAEALAEVRERHKATAKLAAQVAAHPLRVVAALLNSEPMLAQQLVDEYGREAARGHATQAYERLMRIAGASGSALAGLLTAERMANGLSSENVAINAQLSWQGGQGAQETELDELDPEQAAIMRHAQDALDQLEDRQEKERANLFRGMLLQLGGSFPDSDRFSISSDADQTGGS